MHAFAPGEIFLTGFYPERYDYGHVVVTRHTLHGQTLWALHGHLSAKSLEGKVPGAAVEQGEVIGWMGDKEENGEVEEGVSRGQIEAAATSNVERGGQRGCE